MTRGRAAGARLAACLAAVGLAGCAVIGDSRVPIATIEVAAPRPAAERALVIVLPGYGGDAAEMRRRGVAEAIQEAWPEADVVLTEATFAYYRDRRLLDRLQEDVVGPALGKGYRRIWLAGISMGGMGALLYEREHPGALAGIVLLAPFLGDQVLDDIRAGGGLRRWDPGPLPAAVDADHYQRQVWAMVKSWEQRPELARRVWLLCGTSDRLIEGARLLAQELPAANFLERPGAHTWSVWIGGAKELFARVRVTSPKTGDE